MISGVSERQEYAGGSWRSEGILRRFEGSFCRIKMEFPGFLETPIPNPKP